MNLGEIRSAVEDALQHAPTTKAWRLRVRRTVNAVIRDLGRDHEWTAGIREVDFRILPDLTVDDWIQEEGVALGISATLITSGLSPFLAEVDVLDSRHTAIGSRSGAAILWPVPNADGDEVEATIRWKRYPLPADLVSLVSLTVRDASGVERQLTQRGPSDVVGVDDDSDTGDPQWFVEQPAVDWRRRLYGSRDAAKTPAGVGPWEYGITQGPPRITVSQEAGTSSWPTGTVLTYRAALAIKGAGVHGPPGPEVQVTLTGDSKVARISMPVPQTNAEILIWRRRDDGPWMFLTGHDGEDLETDDLPGYDYLDDGTHPMTYGGGELMSAHDITRSFLGGPIVLGYWQDQVIRQIEIRPRPREALVARLAYRPLPRELWEDHDEPAFPASFHDYIVHETVVRLAASNEDSDALVRVHRGLAARVLTQLKAGAGGVSIGRKTRASPLDDQHGPRFRWGTPTWSGS